MEDPRTTYGKDGFFSPSDRPPPIDPVTLSHNLSEFIGNDFLFGEIISTAINDNGVEILLSDYDNWDGGIWIWDVRIFLRPKQWAEIEPSKSIIEAKIADFCHAIIPDETDSFTVTLVARAIYNFSGITNQGRGYSKNPASLEHEGLFFRSKAEINLFIALRETGLPIMPLPVVISNRLDYRRIEPDFVVICKGLTFVIEVDGDRWHNETPAKAQKRLSHLEDQGVRIIRISAEECRTEAIARETTQKTIIPKINKTIESTR